MIKSSDWLSSLVVFIVALPLSLGIALASGAPPHAALITAIIGGVFVGFLSGAPLVVSGPAAGLCLLVYELIQSYGFAGMLWIALIAGAMQIAMGTLKLGSIFNRVPHGILQGMLGAIGLMIGLGQLHVFFGSQVPSNPLIGMLALPESMLGAISLPQIAVCGLIALMVQVAWPKFVPLKIRWIPAALPAVLLATLFALFFSEIPHVQVESLSLGIQSFDMNFGAAVLLSAFGLAMVASAESLLTARAVQGLSDSKKLPLKTDLNRELIAQGAGNILASTLGGIPMTGVIVRSAANINAGAQTRASTILHGVWIFVFVGLFAGLLRSVPMAALASVLIMTGVKLLNLKELKALWSTDREQANYWMGTIVAILVYGLLSGLMIALSIYAMSQAWARFGFRRRDKTAILSG